MEKLFWVALQEWGLKHGEDIDYLSMELCVKPVFSEC